MARYELTEKTTSPIGFQLLEDGEAINLTGMTVSLLLTDRNGLVYSTSVSISSATSGQVTYTPASTDLLAINSPYQARWKLVDANAAVKYCPSGPRDIWEVFAE